MARGWPTSSEVCDVNQFAAAAATEDGDDDDVLWSERQRGITTFRFCAPAVDVGPARSSAHRLSRATSVAHWRHRNVMFQLASLRRDVFSWLRPNSANNGSSAFEQSLRLCPLFMLSAGDSSFFSRPRSFKQVCWKPATQSGCRTRVFLCNAAIFSKKELAKVSLLFRKTFAIVFSRDYKKCCCKLFIFYLSMHVYKQLATKQKQAVRKT